MVRRDSNRNGVRQELRQIDYDGIHATQSARRSRRSNHQCMGVKEILCAEIFYRHQNRVGYYATPYAHNDDLHDVSFRGIWRSDYMCIGWGVAYWRRLTSAFNCMVRMGIRDALDHLSRWTRPIAPKYHVETGSRKQSTQLFCRFEFDGVVNECF
jgi:hypothetical protein